jgi:1-deoxy-D-xylulose-5-phosphate reductoisomerase
LKKRICILGSTGSIGTQTLDIVRANPDRFEVYALCANRSVELLSEQAQEFHPEVVCIADEQYYEPLKAKLSSLDCKVWAGANAIADVVTFPSVDIVVAAMVGYAGLKPTIEAVKAGAAAKGIDVTPFMTQLDAFIEQAVATNNAFKNAKQ